MDRNREARRANIVGSNGFNRRRHRTNSLRDSPDKDGGLELQESVRLRERVKKDRDRERERDRDRERDREREIDRERDLRERSNRSKRRRAERLTSGDETSEESVNDEEDDEDEEIAGSSAATAAAVRFSSPAMGSISNHHQNHPVHGGNYHHHQSHSSSFSQQQQSQHNSSSTSNTVINNNNHHLQHRKTFPPSSSSSSAKVVRAPPPVWKPGDEMISASVPRKARSSFTKRSHDWISSSSNNISGCGDQNPAHPSSSPARQNHALTPTAPLPPAASTSPSTSNASMKKKLKHSATNNNSGQKLKPPKASSSSAKPSTSNPEELEIEIAEVLYGLMTQSQAPPPSSKKEESTEVNRFNMDSKSLNSSPITNNNSILGPNSSPLSAVAPKRKRPRQVPESTSLGARSSTISAKAVTDQMPNSESSSPNLEKISGSATAENGSEMGSNPVISQVQLAEPPLPTGPEPLQPVSDLLKKPEAAELRGSNDLIAKEDVSPSKEQESPALREHDSNHTDSPLIATASSAATAIKKNLIVSEIANQKEEKFEIDLMVPPQARLSPEWETKIDSRASLVVEQKPVLPILVSDLKSAVGSKDTVVEKGKMSEAENEHLANVSAEEKKNKKEAESNKSIENTITNNNKGGNRNTDFRLDLEKPDRDVGSNVNVVVTENKTPMQFINQKQQQPFNPSKEEPLTEKPVISTSSLPVPMSVGSWPGGLHPMGYMAPLQGVISMDGGGVAPAHAQQPLFSQPRPKRCATHCHIARNIHCLQQFMKMNPFWPAHASSPASLFTSKPCNLNVAPPADLNVAARGANNTNSNNSNSAQGKGPSLATNPSCNGGKDRSSQPSTSSDSIQRKQQQILIQQALPPVPPSNLIGPAFIFPLNQQQQAARPGPAANSTTTVSSPNTSSAATISTSAPLPASLSFNYPNMNPNETQYLAILQNNAYPFPIPAVGPPQNYRGPPAQAMPLFNGSFYPSQIIHQQLQQPSSQQPQLMQAHQNSTAANNSSSSSQKQQQIQSQQQQRQQPNNISSQKCQPSQHNMYMQQRNEEISSVNDNRGSRASVNIYGQNFALPIHPQNFAIMTPQATMSTTNNGNQAEKKSNQPHQQQQPGLKNGAVDSLPTHTFAMSFGPSIDASSMAQSQASMFQNCPEGAQQNIQMMATAAVVSQAAPKNTSFRISEDGKPGNSDHSGKEDEKKSFAFTRSDLADTHVTSSIQPNNVIESSGRSITSGPGPVRSSRPATTSGMVMNVVPNAHIQAQLQQQQQQMMQQLKHHHQQQQHQQQQQQQQMAANAVNRANKQPATSNGTMYSEHLNSSSMMAAKFQSTISPFPQNLVQSNSPSPSQSPQWKSSTRTPAAAAQPSPSSLGSSGPSMHKNNNLPQQHSRSQPPMHAQISFGGNNPQKQSAGSQGQAPPTPSKNQVGSPTTSSMSKGTSGSPRTNSSASTNNKVGPGPHGSSFSTQPNKNTPSILGNPHGSKMQAQMQQQQAQQKNMQQQAQLFFSNPYTQPSQSPHSITTSSNSGAPTGYYMPQRRPDQHHRSPSAAFTSSSGVLSLCTPVAVSGTSTNDPATAIAAATCNVKVHVSPFGAQPSGTLLPAGFSYVHPVPAGVQVKPAEQKQPAGNNNLHHQWQPEKK